MPDNYQEEQQQYGKSIINKYLHLVEAKIKSTHVASNPQALPESTKSCSSGSFINNLISLNTRTEQGPAQPSLQRDCFDLLSFQAIKNPLILSSHHFSFLI